MTQPFFCEGSPAMVELESMIDRVGLANVLVALASISRAKAEHLRSNWQDKTSASVWIADARAIDKLAAKVG